MAPRAAAALTLLVSITGCGVAYPDSAAQCLAKESLTAVLHVDLDDPRVIWAVEPNTGRLISLRLPGGYGVTPDDKITDASGRPIAQTGDIIVSGCRDFVQDAVMITEADVHRAPDSN